MRRDARYRRALALADVLAATCAVIAGVAIIGDDSLSLAALLALPVVVLISKVVGLYDRDENRLGKTTLDEAPALFQLATFYTLVVWLGEGTVVDGELGRDQVIGIWGLLALQLVAFRGAARVLVQMVSSPERCLLIGDAESADCVRRKFETTTAAKAVLVGRVPLNADSLNRDGNGTLGSMNMLGPVLVDYDIDRVIIAPGTTDSEEMLDVIRVVKALGVKVSVLPRLFEAVGSSVEFDDMSGVMLLGLRPYGLTQSSQMLKRGLDVTGALAGLIVLAPLLMWLALAVKLTSSGPVLFRQTRIGRHGAEFTMLKFRTMVEDADQVKPDLHALNEADGGLFKIADDPRVTRVGRFLRRSSLDELPQLVNVLKGEMSLVGPRPLVPEEDRIVEGWQRRRLAVTPGMTGLWQIFGSSRIPLQEMVKIDYLYGANWSLWRDLKILIRTVPYALGRRGL